MEKTFMPFTHDDLDFKNELINYARELSKKDTWENKLSAAFIYTSFAEYLASHLLMNLRHIVWMGTQSQFAGILGIDERKDDKKSTLGQLIFKITSSRIQLRMKYQVFQLREIRTLLLQVK
jgi:hypothetical protein